MNATKSLLTMLGETLDEYRAQRRQVKSQDKQQNHQGRFLRWIMPNGGTLLLVAILILTANVWAKPLVTTTNAPGPSATTVNYQGRLADSGGTPITQNDVTLQFAIYDALVDGGLIWPAADTETHIVDVVDGLFSVGLGSATAGGIPTSVWNDDRYLEITVGTQVLSPRELIRSVPIAGMALTLPDGVVDGAMLAETGFGSSNVALSNFVIRGPVTGADLTDISEVQGATWDLRPIVGNSAEMVLLYVRVKDNVASSYFMAYPFDQEPNVRYNAPHVRGFTTASSTGFLWVKCDSQQQIKYNIVAADDGPLSELSVTVIGWVEPAATP